MLEPFFLEGEDGAVERIEGEGEFFGEPLFRGAHLEVGGMRAIACADVGLKAESVEAEDDRSGVVFEVFGASSVEVDDVEEAEGMVDGEGDDLQERVVKRRLDIPRGEEGDRRSEATKILGDLPGVFFQPPLLE